MAKHEVKKAPARYWEPEPGRVERIAWTGAGEMPPGVSLPGVGRVAFPAKEFETPWARLILDSVPGFKLVVSKSKPEPAETKEG